MKATIRRELRGIQVVWQRDVIKFFRNRTRIVISLVQPLLYFFALGTGLSSVAHASGDISYRTFIYPGVLALSLLAPALFSAGTVVFDREFGFMREMMVAPISRTSIVLGKCLGGATVASIQGIVLLALAGVADVPYDVTMLIGLLSIMILLSMTLTAVGVMAAARIEDFLTFQGLIQVVLFPMMFLSGAMYPVNRLPDWLTVLNRLDPITYAVDPMRKLVFAHLDVDAASHAAYGRGVELFGWSVPTGLELLIVAAIGAVAIGIAIARFEALE